MPSYRAEPERHQVQLRRQARAARWLRLRPEGRRQVEGLRILGRLLRHDEARVAARRVRRRRLGRALLQRSTRSTGTRSGSTAPFPGRSSSRTSTSASRRTIRPAPSAARSIPDLKPFRQQELVGGIEHELTAADGACRPATSTSRWTARSKTSASSFPASAKCFTSPIPARAWRPRSKPATARPARACRRSSATTTLSS